MLSSRQESLPELCASYLVALLFKVPKNFMLRIKRFQ
jgi:hypothetical protein